MGIYLYCVVPGDAPDPVVTGLDGAPVRVLRRQGVALWVGDVPSAPRPDLTRIREHDRVIRAAMEQGVSPVPIRFGQVVADEATLEDHLRGRDYRPALERVAGAVEFGIRILDPDAPVPPARTEPPATPATPAAPGEKIGAAYLRTLAARMHDGEARQARSLETARDIDGRLAPWVRESRVDATEQPPGAVVAHLVQTHAADAYGAQARELADGYPPLRIVVTGPWPPYSFVDR